MAILAELSSMEAAVVLGLVAIIAIVALGLAAMLAGWFKLRLRRAHEELCIEASATAPDNVDASEQTRRVAVRRERPIASEEARTNMKTISQREAVELYWNFVGRGEQPRLHVIARDQVFRDESFPCSWWIGDISGSQFIDVDLRGADFTEADLTGTVFLRCQLTRAEMPMQGGYRLHQCVVNDLFARPEKVAEGPQPTA